MIKLTEIDAKKLNEEMLVEGFKTYKSNFFNTEEYKRLATDIIWGLSSFDGERIVFNNCSFSQLLAAGKYVIDKHAHGGDIRVRYTNADSLKADLIYKFGEQPDEKDYDKLVTYIDNNIDLINIFSIKYQNF